jgi:predicted GIY-YIG superfamily endonuclease
MLHQPSLERSESEGCPAGDAQRVGGLWLTYNSRSRLRLGMPSALTHHLLGMNSTLSCKPTYVYILKSQIDSTAHYTGCTSDLRARLKKHNEGGVPHTAKLKPWIIETAVSFRDSTKARAFEKYLKSGSGREFARRHF